MRVGSATACEGTVGSTLTEREQTPLVQFAVVRINVRNCCNCSRPVLAQGCPDPTGPKWSAYWGAPAAHSRAREVAGVAESDPKASAPGKLAKNRRCKSPTGKV